MVTIIPHTTRASGTLLTATIYNTDHQTHVTNATTINADAAFRNVANTWTVGQTFSAATVAGSLPAMIRSVDTSGLEFWGGTSGLGGHLILFGSTHATNANQAFLDGSTISLRGVGGSGTPTVTIGGNTVWHAGNDSGADVGFLNGQSGAFYTNASNLNAGTIADARLPSTMSSKTITGDLVASNGGSVSIVGSGSIELFRSLGAFIDFKDEVGDDFDVRLIHTGFNDLTIVSAGSTASLIMDTAGSLQTPMLTYISSLVIGDNHAEDFRFNADAFLSNGMTVTKTAIGDAGTGVSLDKAGLFWISRSAAAPMIVNRDTSNGIAIQFGMGKTSVGNISVTGSATAYNTSSDERQKNDFQPIDPTLIDQIDVYDFAWNSDGIRAFGVKAQEIDLIIPRVVFKGDNPETDMWSVNYTQLVPILIAKVQDLEARLAILEAA